MTVKFKNWYSTNWLPKARLLTNQMAVMSRFFDKNVLTHETVDALAEKFSEMKQTIHEIEKEITLLEQKKVL